MLQRHGVAAHAVFLRPKDPIQGIVVAPQLVQDVGLSVHEVALAGTQLVGTGAAFQRTLKPGLALGHGVPGREVIRVVVEDKRVFHGAQAALKGDL